MRLVDTHAHIYIKEFDADLGEMIERADKQGVTKILMPAIDSSTHEDMFRVEKEFPGICMSMIGLHPCSVRADYKKELDQVANYLSERKFIAVGEIGLDFYWDLSFKDQQYDSFHQQVEWALQYDIPVVIHSRNSIDECIKLVQEHQKGKLKGVFHCFSGTVEQARKVIDNGLYLGIGGVLTYKKAGLDIVMKETDLGQIVLETDAPYLTPVPFRGKRNESGYISYIAQKLAEIKQLSVEEVAAITTENAQKLFGL
jgi:TatD DNase family protein